LESLVGAVSFAHLIVIVAFRALAIMEKLEEGIMESQLFSIERISKMQSA